MQQLGWSDTLRCGRAPSSSTWALSHEHILEPPQATSWDCCIPRRLPCGRRVALLCGSWCCAQWRAGKELVCSSERNEMWALCFPVRALMLDLNSTVRTTSRVANHQQCMFGTGLAFSRVQTTPCLLLYQLSVPRFFDGGRSPNHARIYRLSRFDIPIQSLHNRSSQRLFHKLSLLLHLRCVITNELTSAPEKLSPSSVGCSHAVPPRDICGWWLVNAVMGVRSPSHKASEAVSMH